MGTHFIKSQKKEVQPCQENFPKSSPSTPWSPSTWPRRDGTASRTSRPRPVASPLPRLAPVLLNLTTSTVVSMLEIGIATRTSPRSSMPSSRTTMESALMLSTLLTWMSTRSLTTLIPLLQSTPPVSVSVAALMDSVSPPGSYYPLTGMDEAVRQQLVDDHFLF